MVLESRVDARRDDLAFNGDRRERPKDVASEPGGTQASRAKSLLEESSLSKPENRALLKASDSASEKRLELKEDNKYVVQSKDSLWSIAQRRLEDDGADAAPNAVNKEVQRLRKLNEGEHRSLKKNADYLRDGWKLQVYDKNTQPKSPRDSAESTTPAVVKAKPETVDAKTPPTVGTRATEQKDAGNPPVKSPKFGAKLSEGEDALPPNRTAHDKPAPAPQVAIAAAEAKTPETKGQPKPDVKPELKPEAKADLKPEAKPEIVPELKSGIKSDAPAVIAKPDGVVQAVEPQVKSAPTDVFEASKNAAARAPESIAPVAAAEQAKTVTAAPWNQKFEPPKYLDGIDVPGYGKVPFGAFSTDAKGVPGYQAPPDANKGLPYFLSAPTLNQYFGPQEKFKPIHEDTAQDDEPFARDKAYADRQNFPFNVLPFLAPKLKSSDHCFENRMQPVLDPKVLKEVPNATYIGECGAIRTLINGKPDVINNVPFWEPAPAAAAFIGAQDKLRAMGKDLKLVDMNSAGRLWEQQEAIRRAKSAVVVARGTSAHQTDGAIDIHESNYDDKESIKVLREFGYVHGNAIPGRHPLGTPISGDPAHFSFREDILKANHPELVPKDERPKVHVDHDHEQSSTKPAAKGHGRNRHHDDDPPPHHRRQHHR